MDSRTLRYEITDVAIDTVKTRVVVIDRGVPIGEPATREDQRDFDPPARQAEIARATRQMTPVQIDAAERRWNALLYEDRWTDEEIAYVRKTWVSADAPVFGTIRMELYGDESLEARLELRRFGTSHD